MKDLTDKVIGAAIEVHRVLGPGLLESIYEEALCVELSLRDISFERPKEVEVVYKGKRIKGQRVDLVVEKVLVVELKAVANLPEADTAQALSYLKATDLRRALLINFSAVRLVDGVKEFPCKILET
ncbi:MAG: hypothetical protein JL50_11190 [Peptococcaceae bacterium BICA1-7]|nr:MAG: hypothetical protein JL50_11190 [Peptococcaceae bacterium BICA1-7]